MNVNYYNLSITSQPRYRYFTIPVEKKDIMWYLITVATARLTCPVSLSCYISIWKREGVLTRQTVYNLHDGNDDGNNDDGGDGDDDDGGGDDDGGDDDGGDDDGDDDDDNYNDNDGDIVVVMLVA